MKGMDYFAALRKNVIVLPVRVFIDGSAPNLYRPNALSFCNLTLEEDDEITPEAFKHLEGYDVSLIADGITERVREVAKAVIPVNPCHLVVAAGDTLASWAPHRGWK
jgi:hypothetical protein